MVVVGDDGLVAVLAADLDVLQPLRDDELLLVGAALDEDDLVVVHEGAAHLDGVGDGAELSCAVAGDDDGVGVIVLAGGRGCQHGCQ